MVNRELMKNKDRLERIEVIREVRRKLGNFNFQNEEKSIILKSLNDYENTLTIDITRSINNIKEFETLGISHDIEVINVPIDINKPTYPEFANLYINESLELSITRLGNLINQISYLDIFDDEKRVLLESLKEYSNYLRLLVQKRENNKKLYEDEFLNDGTLSNNFNK